MVYSCASITFPLLAQYALTRNKPRGHRRLYERRDEFVEDMREHALKNQDLLTDLRHLGLID